MGLHFFCILLDRGNAIGVQKLAMVRLRAYKSMINCRWDHKGDKNGMRYAMQPTHTHTHKDESTRNTEIVEVKKNSPELTSMITMQNRIININLWLFGLNAFTSSFSINESEFCNIFQHEKLNTHTQNFK